MRIALIDDNGGAHDNFESVAAAMPRLSVVRELSRPIMADGGVYDEALKWLGTHEGELLLIVDLKLDLNSFDDGEFRAAVTPEKQLLQECSDEWQPDSPAMFQGLWVAAKAILASQIDPLVIVVASSVGRLDYAKDFLSAVARRARPSGNYRLLLKGTTCAKPPKAKEIVDELVKEYDRAFGDRLTRFLTAIRSVTHRQCESADPAAIAALGILLGMSEEEIRSCPCGAWLRGMKNLGAMDNDGRPMDRPLSLLGGWLLAFGAHRQLWPEDNWQSVFGQATTWSVEEWVADCHLTPQQSWAGLKQSIKAFDRMCCHLFRKNDGDTSHPAQLVSLNKENGLEFRLGDFDPLAGGTHSLYHQLFNWSRASLGGGEAVEKHHAAEALWRFLLCSYVADKYMDNQEHLRGHIETIGMFGSVARMNILYDSPSGSAIIRFK